ncbi:MAG: response regulator [Magnetococcales bacterium]|nr:response regulator [Magnetococcales bacterium]
MAEDSGKAIILIVDDGPENLDVLKNILMDEYMVRPAIHGTLALRLAFLDPQPDLILLDITMPGMSGYEVCRILKADARTREIPVIFVTSRAGDLDERDGLSMGAVDYITKPISPGIVKARIRTQITLRRLQRRLEEKNRRLFALDERLNESRQLLFSSDECLRGLVQILPDIVFKLDVEGRFTFLSQTVECLGYHPSELLGRHFSEIVDPEDLPAVSLERVLERGGGLVNPGQKVFDERRTTPRITMGLGIRVRTQGRPTGEGDPGRWGDGGCVSVEVNSSGLYGDPGDDSTIRFRSYLGTVGVMRDVSELRKAQQAILEERQLRLTQSAAHTEALNQQAVQSRRAQGDFLTNVSREIRTPLNALLGLAWECLQSGLTPRQHEWVSAIHHTAGNLLHVLESRVDFARIEADRLFGVDGEPVEENTPGGQQTRPGDFGVGVDVVTGLHNVGGKEAIYRSVLSKFVRNQRDACVRMEQQMAGGDPAGLERTAHTLKGVAALIGAQSLSALAKRIELRAKEEERLDRLGDLLGETARELQRIVAGVLTGLQQAELAVSGAEATGDDDDLAPAPAGLAPLMRQVESLLCAFDSSVDTVVEQMLPLAPGMVRKERIGAMRKALMDYDFDTCLVLLQEWARDEAIVLSHPTL